MVNYHLTIITPAGYIHSLAFKEIALLLLHSFKSLGVSCTFKLNELQKDKVNIVLGYHLADPAILKHFQYIPYQLEQLSAKNGWFNEQVLAVLKNAYEVWDYSAENIVFLEQYGIKPKILPIGYHDALCTIKETAKDIDVLFYGCINERRKRVLDQLIALGVKVECLFNVYGQKRDDYIARAKIVLNIHFYDSQILEVVRISYLLNNRVFVLSEDSFSNPYKDTDLVTVSYDALVISCQKYLNNLELLEKTKDTSYQKFKANYQMSKFLDRVV